MDMTQAQKDVLTEYKRVFGKEVIKEHAPRASDGVMRIEAKAQAGIWQWSINQDGECVYSCLNQHLFEPPPATKKRKRSETEEYSATQKRS